MEGRPKDSQACNRSCREKEAAIVLRDVWLKAHELTKEILLPGLLQRGKEGRRSVVGQIKD